jgi:hypothetical protein
MPAAPHADLDWLCDALLSEAARRAPPDLQALAARHPASAPLPGPLVARLHAQREALAEWLEASVPPHHPGAGWRGDPAGFLADRVLRYLLGRNQFLPLGGARVAALEALHARALAAATDTLREADSEPALAAGLTAVATAYRDELAAFVAELRRADRGGADPALREVSSAEYTPALQLRILGLDPDALPEPILDLGCGAGALVRALRARGKEARGVDRLAEPGDGLSRGDWLELPLPPSTFGAVISHLAFSLHFVHHHLQPGDEPLRYARRYMEILRALRPGGLFAYAPGLPFVEEHLDPAAWRVERTAVPAPPPDPLALAIPWYACRVFRLA